MPPRHTYWTIILDNQPTAFRSATRDELLPTLRQLQSKHPSAVMMWFARGRLWPSEEEARAAFERDRRPAARDRQRTSRPPGPRPQWRDRSQDARRPGPGTEWRNRPQGDRAGAPRSEWRERPPSERPRAPKPEWRDRPQAEWPRGRKPEWRNRPQHERQKTEEGRPNEHDSERRGRDWRPGGAHRDPRARFKVPRDIKRARLAARHRWKKKKKDDE
jgi:hypothetical protein